MAIASKAKSRPTLGAYDPPIVISVHGIRTYGRWQKSLADTLGSHGIKHRSYDFGHYSLLRFFWGPSRERTINEFYDFYSNLLRVRPKSFIWNCSAFSASA